jgi:hypothetical protein
MKFKTLLLSLARSLPPTSRILRQRDNLIIENAELAKQVSASKAEIELLVNESQSIHNWGTPCYDQDYMRLWFRNMDFMSDPNFQTAYAEGANSRHGLTNGEPLHIEWRILVCIWAAWHANRLTGDFVECGTNTGIMSLAICNYLQWNTLNKNFYLFDTFDGIPAEQIRADEKHALTQNKAYRDCFQIAQENFSAYHRIQFVKGKVPETLARLDIPHVAYLMLDMNILFPEQAALEFFWDKLVPGGIVLFDDYGWSGYHLQKEAHDNFAAGKGLKILNLPTGQGMLLKPS